MPSPVLAYHGRELMESGLYVSIHPLDAIFWVEGENLIFNDAAVGKARGFTKLTELGSAEVVRGLLGMRQASQAQRLYIGTPTRLLEWDIISLADVSKAGGYTGQVDETSTAPATAWSFVTFGDWVIATNGEDPLQVYKPASMSAFEDLAGPTFPTAQVIVNRGPHTFALNTGGNGKGVAWSDSGDPETWLASSDNLAGDLTLRELSGPIRGGALMGDRVAVYSENELILVAYTGGAAIYSATPALVGPGTVGKFAVTAVGRMNYGVKRKRIWRSDGVSYEYIDEPAISRWLEDNVNWDQASKIVAHHVEDEESVHFWFPTSGTENAFGWAFNYANKTWAPVNYARTSTFPRGIFKWPLAADAAGVVWAHLDGVDAYLSALPSRARSKPLTLGAADRRKKVTQVRLHLRNVAGTGVRVRFGTTETLDPDEAIDWDSWQAITEDAALIDLNNTAFYHYVEIETQNTGDDFSLAGIEWYGRTMGTRR